MSYDDVKVYVGNLPNDIDKRELEDEFDRFGRVSKVQLRAPICSGRIRIYFPLKQVWVARNPPGFAFVHFEDIRDAEGEIFLSCGVFWHFSLISLARPRRCRPRTARPKIVGWPHQVSAALHQPF